MSDQDVMDAIELLESRPFASIMPDTSAALNTVIQFAANVIETRRKNDTPPVRRAGDEI